MVTLTVYLSDRRLWDRTIHCGTHDSLDSSPALPMFGPTPKHQKKESFTDPMTNAAVAFAKAISPSTQETSSPHHQCSTVE